MIAPSSGWDIYSFINIFGAEKLMTLLVFVVHSFSFLQTIGISIVHFLPYRISLDVPPYHLHPKVGDSFYDQKGHLRKLHYGFLD